MKSQAYWLLTNEGYLAGDCLKRALRDLKGSDCTHWRAFYPALFMYTIGLERMLKLALLVEHYHDQGGHFPPLKIVKDEWGHNLLLLYETFEKARSKYRIKTHSVADLDSLDSELLGFLSEFAERSRYYNLDMLVGSAKSSNPLLRFQKVLDEVCESDVSEIKRVSSEEQASAMVAQTSPFVYSMPEAGPDGAPESYNDRCQDSAKIRLAVPALVWRLVKRLLPIKEFLWHFHPNCPPLWQTQVDRQDIPALCEFLFFASSNRTIMDEPDWLEP